MAGTGGVGEVRARGGAAEGYCSYASVCTEDTLATWFLKLREWERFMGTWRETGSEGPAYFSAGSSDHPSVRPPGSLHCGSTSSAPGIPCVCHMPSRLITVAKPVSPRVTIERSESSTNEDNWVFAACQSCRGGAPGGWVWSLGPPLSPGPSAPPPISTHLQAACQPRHHPLRPTCPALR